MGRICVSANKVRLALHKAPFSCTRCRLLWPPPLGTILLAVLSTGTRFRAKAPLKLSETANACVGALASSTYKNELSCGVGTLWSLTIKISVV
jgi:hypothetical protein